MWQPPCDKCRCRLIVDPKNYNKYLPCRCLDLKPYDHAELMSVRYAFDAGENLRHRTIQRLFDTIEMTQMRAGESRRAMFDALPED